MGSGEKSGAENIELHFGSAALERQNRLAIAILQRVALRIETRVAQPASALLIAKSNGHVQETNALHIRGNERLGRVAVLFHERQPRIGVLQLFLQRGNILGS